MAERSVASFSPDSDRLCVTRIEGIDWSMKERFLVQGDEVTKLANEFLVAPVTFVQFPPLLDKFLQRFFCIVLFFVQCDAGFLESLDTRTEGRKVRIKALVSCNVLNPMA